MKFAKRSAIALALAAAASGAAVAGEDSTERWSGFGQAYWESSCGLTCYRPDVGQP